MKKAIALLATATVLGLNVTPTFAEESLEGSGSDGVVQTQTQETIITGDGNATYQGSSQRSTNVRNRLIDNSRCLARQVSTIPLEVNHELLVHS